MGKIAFIADAHLGNHRRFGGPSVGGVNTRARMILSALRDACGIAVSAGCSALVIAGDLFDYGRPEAALLAAVQVLFAGCRAAGCEVITLTGNHDLASCTPGDHACAPLAPCSTVIDSPCRMHVGSADLVLVPFRAGAGDAWLADCVHDTLEAGGPVRGDPPPPPPSSACRILTIHLGVRDSSTPVWLASSEDSVSIEVLRKIAEDNGITHVMAGNWHYRRSWSSGNLQVLQVGALAPTGWDNPGVHEYGTAAIVDTNTGATEICAIPGPRFVVASDVDSAKDAFDAVVLAGCHPYLSIRSESRIDVGMFEELVNTGELGGLETRVSMAAVADAAHRAAASARASETLDEALVGYVESMSLEDGVSRDVVAELARGYLR